MRQQGRLTEWNDERGFGFITPLDGSSRVFAHVSEFPSDKRRPVALDLVTYDPDRDHQGRLQAKDVLFMAPTGPAQPAAAPPWRLRIALAVSALLLASVAVAVVSASPGRVSAPVPASNAQAAGDQAIAAAYSSQRSGVQVSGEGVVTRVLSDDDEGSRHQRFILRLASGQTLLFAHNIDIAPRLTSLAPGDSVGFYGVYEWNSEGGVIHWTHRDPSGQHATGWLKHNGVTSQ